MYIVENNYVIIMIMFKRMLYPRVLCPTYYSTPVNFTFKNILFLIFKLKGINHFKIKIYMYKKNILSSIIFLPLIFKCISLV